MRQPDQRGERLAGWRARMLLQHRRRRVGDGRDLQDLQRGDGGEDDDDRGDGDADRAGDGAARRGGAFGGDVRLSSTASGASPMLIPARPSSRSRLSAPSTASTTWRTTRARIRPAKKNRPAPSRRGRKAKTSLVRLVTGVSTADEAERLQRGDQPDQPDQPIGEAAELGADRFAAGLRMALEHRHPVDALRDRPLHAPWRRNGSRPGSGSRTGRAVPTGTIDRASKRPGFGPVHV